MGLEQSDATGFRLTGLDAGRSGLRRPPDSAPSRLPLPYFGEPDVAPEAGYFFRISASELSRFFLSGFSLAS